MDKDVVVQVTIRGLDKMKRGQRRKIYNYLRARANWVLEHGDLAASLFRAKLYR